MKKRLLAILFVAAATFFANHCSAQVIIANNSVKVSDTSKSELKEVFTGSASSIGGSHVIPVLLKEGAVEDQFLAAYIGKANAAFVANWRSLVFSGQATMPKSLNSDAAVVEYVAHNPGAIGYIGRSSPHEGVKVIAVR
jgi:ABC-type phosphate transport system substrate-binding protein